MPYPLLKVGPARWTIEKVSHLTASAESEGQTHHSSETIYIHASLPLERARHVLLHEVLHVCADFVGIKDDERLSEEEFITRIAPALAMVLTDNRWLVRSSFKNDMALQDKLRELGEEDEIL